MKDELRILVPGAGGPGTVNLCRSLRRAPEPVYLVGTDCDPYFGAAAITDEIHVVPHAREEKAYIEAIRRLIKEAEIDLIMPNNSIEIRALAAHRSTLDAALFIPGEQALDLANSKWASYERWRGAEIPLPQTFLLEDESDLKAVFEALDTRPVWVRGAGIPGKGIGVASLPCRTFEQAQQWVDYWKGWGGMIASEFLPGRNLTWIGVFKDGVCVTGQCRERDRYVIPHVSPSGITGAPAVSHTVHRSDVEEIAKKAALVLDPALSGVVFVDLKEDAGGTPRVTELNAGRFGTTHFFYTAAGLNLPWITACLALGRDYGVVAQSNPLPADLYWVRTLDVGPVLISADDVAKGNLDRGQRFGLYGEPVRGPSES